MSECGGGVVQVVVVSGRSRVHVAKVCNVVE